jgi:hypothetical protein
MPILLAICVYPAFVLEAQFSFWRAFLLLLFWTIWLSIIVLFFSYKNPESMERIIWRSADYRQAMFDWIESGVLPEGSALRVALFHIRQALLYCVAAIATANFLSILLGAALLNYMNYYVATFAKKTRVPLLAIFMAWNPWSVIRVVSFLWLGVVLSAPLLRLFYPVQWGVSWALTLPAIVGVVLDVVLKLSLSNVWRLTLKKML